MHCRPCGSLPAEGAGLAFGGPALRPIRPMCRRVSSRRRNQEFAADVRSEFVDERHIAFDDAECFHDVLGPKLKAKLETTQELRIVGGDVELVVTGGLETPKPNLGDYAGMENIGGTFPIGEVFTESRDFSRMNGSFMIYAYAGGDFSVNMHKPFRVDVEEGVVVRWHENAPKSFVDIVEAIKLYERPLIREIGFGLNRAITRERYLQDITAFERILGMHLSMGEKHSVFKKVGITTHKTKFHVDLFPVADRVTADGEVIFENGKYLL